MESVGTSPARVWQDSIRSPGIVSILKDSIGSPSGAQQEYTWSQQDSLIVYTGCYLERVLMDSWWTPGGLLVDS